MSITVQPIPLDKEYAKHKNLTREDIKILREWVKTQPHLPEKHISDLDLILAYHCCDRSSQLTKEVLDSNLTSRTLITAIFGHREVNDKIIEAAKTVAVFPLSDTDSAETAYLYAALVRCDIKYYNFSDIVRLVLMCFDLFQYETGSSPWFSLIIDLRGATWSHITRIDLMVLRQLIYYLEECILVKIKNIHFLNAPSFIDKFIALLKPLMKKELFESIKVYTIDSPTVYEYIPKKALPKECGGEYLSTVEITKNVIKQVQANKKFFEEENLKRINKSLRPNGKHATIEDILGIQGSFKKLDID